MKEAKIRYEKILSINPTNFDALHLLAIIHSTLRNFTVSIDLFTQALRIQPQHAVALSNLANAYLEFGFTEKALDKVVASLGIDDANANGWLIYANILKKSLRFSDSLISYERAITLAPNMVSAIHNRSVVLSDLKRFNEALTGFDLALHLSPYLVESHNGRGIALSGLKRDLEALDCYQKAINIKTDYAEAYSNRGASLERLNRLEEAIADYRHAIHLSPDFFEAYSNLGSALLMSYRLEEGLASIDKSIGINPKYAKAHFNRGLVLYFLGRPSEAVAGFKTALELDPDYDIKAGLVFLLLANLTLCDWRTWKEDLSRFIEDVKNNKIAPLPFPCLVFIDDSELHLQIAVNFVHEECPVNNALGGIDKRPADGKLRLGYFSADLYYHPVAIWLAEQVENHDKSKFELFAFSLRSNIKDPMRTRLEAAFDHFIEVDGKSDLEITKLSRDLGIDIALDLSGHTLGSRPRIFAARAAPIQVNALGFPGSWGADYIDYLITDVHAVPESAQHLFKEKISYVPCNYTYDRQRQVSTEVLRRSQFSLPEDAFVFTCQNGSQKISPEVFDVWMNILKAVPHSVLWLLQPNPTATENLKQEAKARGVDATRLVFTNREVVSPDEETARIARYLASYKLADLFLDTWPYNAGTTAVDALWAGLPVLTKSGEAMVARMAASALQAIEMPELITTTKEQYEATAIELATIKNKLQTIREKLERNRLTTALFDPVTNTKHLETAYLQMHQKYQNGI